MKGQMFIIVSIIIVFILVMISNSIDITSVLENKKHLEAGLERLEFENAKDESIRTLQYSANFTENITGKVETFLRFSRSVFRSRTMDFNALSVSSRYSNASAGNEIRANFSVFNMLGDEIKFLNLTFSSTNISSTFSNVDDTSTVTANSTFNTNEAVNYTLTVFYNTTHTNSSQAVLVPVEMGKSKLVNFFVLELKSNRLTQLDKFTETIDLPR